MIRRLAASTLAFVTCAVTGLAQPVGDHGHEVVLRIVDAASGRPMPQALVEVFDARISRRILTPGRPRIKPLPTPTWQGRADDTGTVRFDFDGPATIRARIGDRAGRAAIKDPRTKEVTVRLARVRDLDARLVDGRGRPVGEVEVSFRVGHRVHGGTRSRQYRATSLPESGLASVTLPAAPPSDLAAKGQVETTVDFSLTSGLWSMAWLKQVRSLPEDPVTLVLPDHGALRVEVRTPEGARLDVPASFVLGRTTNDATPANGIPLESSVTVEASQGTAIIPFVPLSLPLGLVTFVEGYESVFVAVPPLSEAGQEQEVLVTVSRRLPVVTMTVVDADGRALANREARVTIGPAGTTDRRRRGVRAGCGGLLETDASGRVRVPFDPARLDGGPFAIQAEVLDRRGQIAAVIEAALPADLRREALDLGEQRPDERFVLATGRVVDGSGSPVAGATVSVDHTIRGEFRFGGLPWTDLQRPTAKTSSAGGFRLIGWPDIEIRRYRVYRVWAPGASMAVIEAQPGKTDEPFTLIIDRPVK